MNLIINTDGGARGNPGPAGFGVVIRDQASGDTLEEHGIFIGATTNNQAEYRGAIFGLERALALGAQSVEIISDSELLIKQARGIYKVKNAELAHRFLELKNLETALGNRVKYTHVRREHNKRADELANKAMDEGQRAL